MKSYDTPTSSCPTCGYGFECASSMLKDGKPKPGDISVCLKCGEILVFDQELKQKVALLDDMIDLDYRQFKSIEFLQQKIRKERPLG